MSARQEVSVCREWGWRQSHPSADEAEQGGRREGKIKADGTPWVRSAGQALVCTLFWGAAHGTLLLGLACRDMAQSLGFVGFWPAL